jgi:peptide/nickel transport system substrate-binding protein
MDSGPMLEPPSDIDAWNKYILGWVDPVMVDSPSGEYVIHTLESSQDPKALIVGYTGANDMYYFIQARRRTGTDSGLPADGVLVFLINPTQEQSLSGSELALLEDANPGTLEASGQYYLTDQGAMYYELLDAPYNKGDETYHFSMGSISAQFVLKNDLFWDQYNKIAFLVEPTGDDSFRIRFGSSPEELGREAPQEQGGGTQPSGCIIATAAYGSELSPSVQALRDFRDKLVRSTFAGDQFMDAFNMWYYSFSPTVANVVASSSILRMISRILIHPLVGILQLSTYVYNGLAFNRELGIVSTGLVASSLIGVVYFAPWITALQLCARKRNRLVLQVRNLRPFFYAWIAAIALIGAAEVLLVETLMIAATVALVLLTLGLSATVTAVLITQRTRMTVHTRLHC